jgi:DNA repair protein RadC
MKVRLSKEHRNKQISYGGSLYPVMQQILMRESPNLRSGHRAIEHFGVASLDNKNRLLNVELVNLGSVNRLQVSQPKVGTEVFRIAIYKTAPRVVLVHNHPSGDIGKHAPNEHDKNFTDHMIKAGKLLDIDVADHLVITETDYYSFNDRGYMQLLLKSGKYEITLAETEEMKKWKIEFERKTAKEENSRAIAARLLEKGISVNDVVAFTKLRKSSVEKMMREIGKE